MPFHRLKFMKFYPQITRTRAFKFKEIQTAIGFLKLFPNRFQK